MAVPPEWRDPPRHPGDLCDEQGVVTWPCPYPHEHPPEGARFPLAGYWVGNDHPLLEYWRKCGIFVPCLFLRQRCVCKRGFMLHFLQSAGSGLRV